MKKLLLVLIFASCSSGITVHTDFDKSIEIHRRTNYGWLNQKELESRNNPLVYNELIDKRIKTAVNAGLAAKGYKLDVSQPEFLVHYHITIEEKAQKVETEPFGYSYGEFWTRNQTDVRRYEEGTLIVDFMDAGECELVWRGWAVSILDEDKLVTERLINDAVTKILERFPPSAEYEMKN